MKLLFKQRFFSWFDSYDTITDEFIETRQLAKRISTEKFEIGNWKFTKCAYEVKK